MSIFPTRVLLATDGSADADLALSTAVDIANSTNSELHVVTVGPGSPDRHTRRTNLASATSPTKKLSKRSVRKPRACSIEQIKKVEEAGGTVAGAHLQMQGPKDQAIVRLSEELGVGLIVMGSRGLGGLRRALMGSVAGSVVRHAHCPVLVVRR